MKWKQAKGKITRESKEVYVEGDDGEWMYLKVKRPDKMPKVTIEWENLGIKKLD